MADGTIRIDTNLDSSGLEKGLKTSDVLVAGAAAVIGGALVGAIKSAAFAAIELGAEFEQKMSRVNAISGATSSEFAQLEAQAKSLGATTAFSASEAAEGMENLASAGFTANEIMGAMPGLLDLAAVSGGDVGRAAEVAGAAINAFGLEATQAGHVADVLARAAADTNAEVHDMGEALKYAGPIAYALGISMEETAAAVGIMSDAGIKGSQAGTSLRGALTRLTKPTKQMTETMNDFGISLRDSEGNMLGISEIVAELKTKLEGAGQAEKERALATIFGTEAMSGWLALIEAGPDKIDELTASLENSAGAADEMARIMQDNLKGDVEELGGAFETLGLEIYDVFKGALREGVQGATVSVNKLTDTLNSPKMQASLQKLANEVGKVIAKVAELATKAIPPLVSAIGFVIGHGDKLTAVLAGLAAAFAIQGTISAWNTAVSTANSLMLTATTATEFMTLVLGKKAIAQAAEAAATTVGTIATTANTATLLASTGVITAKTLLVGVLTGNIGLATAAHMVWNAVIAANPFGLLAIAIGVVVAGIGLLIAFLNDAKTEAELFAEELEVLQTEIDELSESVKDSASAYTEKVESLKANGIAADTLAKKIINLSEKENKSVADKAQLKMYVDMLNQSVSGLNLKYDKQNDKLNMNAREINKVTAAWKENLLLEAKKERAMEIAREMAETEQKLAEATEKQTEAQRGRDAQLDITTGKLKDLEDAIFFVNARFIAANKELKESEENLSAATGKVTELEAQYGSLEQEFDSLAESYAETETQMAESTSAMESSAESLSDTIEDEYSVIMASNDELLAHFSKKASEEQDLLAELEKAYESYADMTTNIFGKIKGESSISVAEMIENLTFNANAVENWSNHLASLVARGLDEGLVGKMRAAGPEMASTVAAMVNMSDEELAKLEGAFRRSTNVAVDAAREEFQVGADENMGSAYVESIIEGITLTEEELLESATGLIDGTKTATGNAIVANNFDEDGKKIVDNVGEGIKSNSGLNTAMTEGVSSAQQTTDSLINDGSFERSGQNIVDNVASGLDANTAVNTAIESVLTIAQTTAASFAKSGMFDRVGEYMAQGIAAGLTKGQAGIAAAASAAVDVAHKAVNQAADINSPAKRFMPSGERMDEGVAVGILSKGFTPKAAAKLIDGTVTTINAQQADFANQAQSNSGSTYFSSSNTDTKANNSVNIDKVVIEVNETAEAGDIDTMSKKIMVKAKKIERQKGVLLE